jgi:antirestriction protein ArdC
MLPIAPIQHAFDDRGIPAGFRSTAYLDHWLKVLKEDHRAIFSAASYASHAADWIRNWSVEAEDKEHAVTGPDYPDELARKADERKREMVDEIAF